MCHKSEAVATPDPNGKARHDTGVAFIASTTTIDATTGAREQYVLVYTDTYIYKYIH